jgi:hypothetical protein
MSGIGIVPTPSLKHSDWRLEPRQNVSETSELESIEQFKA